MISRSVYFRAPEKPLIFLFARRFIPESLRWHRSKNNLKEVEKILQKIAKINKRTYPSNATLEPVEITDEEKNATFRDLFTSCHESLKVFLVCFIW